ncbi:MAG: TonB-dependent receptor, partial [Ferruginibacter sp.]|nr:TonB-dependent receptor [Ferruginibacter sp.]
MKQYFFTLLVLLCFSVEGIYAQHNPAKISGSLYDQKDEPISYASVVLLTSDSIVSLTTLSDTKGRFEFHPVKADNYFIKVDGVGFETFHYGPVFYDGITSVLLKPVHLVTSSKTLSAVVVSSKKPMIEVKADKTVFNVEASINATGSNALELLQKSPGVTVDNNDNISMKGKTGVKIYVDGKMLQLDAKELAEYLKNINSNDVEAIEMISNPGAKYDASGNAGIINFRLKKSKRFGTNGSVSLGFVQGITPKGNGSVALNYRNKKMNVFGNVSGNLGNYRNELNFYRIQKDSLYDQKSINTSRRKSMNIKAGADYFINPKSTLGVLANVNLGDNRWTSNTHTDISFMPTNTYQKTLESFNSVSGGRTNANFNMNYRYADTSGKEYNVDLDYGFFNSEGRSYQPNNYYDENGNLLYAIINRNYAPTKINLLTFKGDAERKLGKGKLGYGIKAAYVTTRNTFDFFNDDINGKPVIQYHQSNDFSYTENVNAAYLNYNTVLGKKWNLQAGLRAEQTNSEGKLTRKDGTSRQDDRVNRHYFDLFPSAAISWTINDKHALNLSYSRRIDRPSYQDLNPFENKLDELTYEKGNAFLRPQYSDNIELTHSFLGKINTSIGYSFVRDFSTELTDTLGNA